MAIRPYLPEFFARWWFSKKENRCYTYLATYLA